MSLTVKPLQAFHGDSILISFYDDENKTNRNILVDGGPGNTYSQPPLFALKNEIERIKEAGESIDLLVITHIDDDHIGGIINMFEYDDENINIIKKCWFNSGGLISSYFNSSIDPARDCRLIMRNDKRMSFSQGVTLENYLKKLNCWEQQVIYSGSNPINFFGSTIHILSPNEDGLKKLNDNWEKEKRNKLLSGDRQDYQFSISNLIQNPFKEDAKIPNKSSIAFLFEYKGKRILMLGDAHPSVVAESLKKMGNSSQQRMQVDLVKVPHHGSRGNLSPNLLDLIECDKYLISTDSRQHGLPDKEAMARIIASNDSKTYIYFNYDIAENIFTEEDHNEFKFELKYLNSEGIKID